MNEQTILNNYLNLLKNNLILNLDTLIESLKSNDIELFTYFLKNTEESIIKNLKNESNISELIKNTIQKFSSLYIEHISNPKFEQESLENFLEFSTHFPQRSRLFLTSELIEKLKNKNQLKEFKDLIFNKLQNELQTEKFKYLLSNDNTYFKLMVDFLKLSKQPLKMDFNNILSSLENEEIKYFFEQLKPKINNYDAVVLQAVNYQFKNHQKSYLIEIFYDDFLNFLNNKEKKSTDNEMLGVKIISKLLQNQKFNSIDIINSYTFEKMFQQGIELTNSNATFFQIDNFKKHIGKPDLRTITNKKNINPLEFVLFNLNFNAYKIISQKYGYLDDITFEKTIKKIQQEYPKIFNENTYMDTFLREVQAFELEKTTPKANNKKISI